jgi:hypothetical protein
MDAYNIAFQRLLDHPQDPPLLVFVGPPCRTWYTDIDRLLSLMTDLRDTRMYAVVHAGAFPFDMYVDRFAQDLGIERYLVGPEDRELRLRGDYHRDPEMVVGTTMIIAFPVEEAGGSSEKPKATRRYPAESADLDVVRAARRHGVPVLAVYRSGQAEWSEEGT